MIDLLAFVLRLSDAAVLPRSETTLKKPSVPVSAQLAGFGIGSGSRDGPATGRLGVWKVRVFDLLSPSGIRKSPLGSRLGVVGLAVLHEYNTCHVVVPFYLPIALH
jgi:hypothetical protein